MPGDQQVVGWEGTESSKMATNVAQREATGTRWPAIRGGPVLAASLTAPDVPDPVQRRQFTKLIARGTRQSQPGAVSRA